MKKLFSLALALALCLGLTVPAFAAIPDSGTAYASTQSVLVDGKPVQFQMYALKDAKGNYTNYVKLRDLALILSGTRVQFDVIWDGYVRIEPGKPYTPNGSEMSTPFSGNRAYEAASSASMDAIVLKDDRGGAYTYYQLRDLGRALNFYVDWSAEKGVFVDTSYGATRNMADRDLMELAEEALYGIPSMLFRLEAGSLVEHDTSDFILRDEAGNFKTGTPYDDGWPYYRVPGYTNTADLNDALKDVWYQSFSRKYDSFPKDFTGPFVEYNGAVYVSEIGFGDGSISYIIDKMISRTDDEAIFRTGRHADAWPADVNSFTFSLVYEDGTWKYGFCEIDDLNIWFN